MTTMTNNSNILELMEWLSEKKVTFLESFLNGRNRKKPDCSAYRAWFDGSYRQINNTSTSSFFIVNEDGKIIHQYFVCYSSNTYGSAYAEQTAFELLLKYLLNHNIKDVIIYGDCSNVIEVSSYEIIKSYNLNEDYLLDLRWIPRYFNFYADYLCTQAYDSSNFLNDDLRQDIYIHQVFNKHFKINILSNLHSDYLDKGKFSIINKTIFESKKNFNLINKDICYLLSKKNINDYKLISQHQVLRLMDRNMVTVINRHVVICDYSFEELENFTIPLNLLLWDIKNKNDIISEEQMSHIKNQEVHLVDLNTQIYRIINTKEAKYLLQEGIVKIFAEDVLFTKSDSIKIDRLLSTFNEKLFLNHKNDMFFSLNSNNILLQSQDLQECITINLMQAKQLLSKDLAVVIDNNTLSCVVATDDLTELSNTHSLAMWLVRNSFSIEDKKDNFTKDKESLITLISNDGFDYVLIPAKVAIHLIHNNLVTVFSPKILISKYSKQENFKFVNFA